MKNHRGRNKSQNRVMKDPHARSATDRDGRVIAIAFESAHDRDPDRSIFFGKVEFFGHTQAIE